MPNYYSKFTILFLLILITIFSPLVTFLNANEITLAEVTKELKNPINKDKISEICKNYFQTSKDVEILREVQSTWLRVNKVEALKVTKEMYEKNSTSPLYTYLYGRTFTDSPLEELKYGTQVVNLDANFPYGYRLILYIYSTYLFEERADKETLAKLESSYNETGEQYFKDFFSLKTEFNKDYALKYKANYYMYKKDYSKAFNTLETAKKINGNTSFADNAFFGLVYVKLGNFDEALISFTKNSEEMVKSGRIKADEVGDMTKNYYTYYLGKEKKYEEIIKYLKDSNKDFETNKDVLYEISCNYSLLDYKKQALNYLIKASKNSWDRIEHLNKDKDMDNIRDETKFKRISKKIEKAWNKGAELRKEEILKSKFSKIAPDWELLNKEGKLIKLSEQKGKVIILDFWATWCSPCKMAMPILDNFVDNNKSDKVEIFSINVWERKSHEEVEKFLKDLGYDMTLLYGSNELTKKYGITGIPYICAIDKDGNIRFEERGFSDTLKENLNWWIEDLINE